MIKISIITVTYQSVNTLGDTMTSVFSQTYPNIEYIIVDGGSTDGTVDLIKQHESKIARWVSEPDGGIYDAMNKGITMASGDIIGFLHADDLLASPNVIEMIANCFNSQSVDAVYGDLEYVQKEDVTKVVRFWKSQPFSKNILKRGWMPPHPTLYVSKAAYGEIGVFKTSYRISADYDFILRLFLSPMFTFGYINNVFVKMRLGGTSNRSIKNIIRKSKEDFHAINSNKAGGLRTLLMKNIGKLHQFFVRDKIGN